MAAAYVYEAKCAAVLFNCMCINVYAYRHSMYLYLEAFRFSRTGPREQRNKI